MARVFRWPESNARGNLPGVIWREMSGSQQANVACSKRKRRQLRRCFARYRDQMCRAKSNRKMARKLNNESYNWRHPALLRSRALSCRAVAYHNVAINMPARHNGSV